MPHEGQELEGQNGFRVQVLDGALRAVIAGETFEVPAGTPHQMAGDGPARLHWEAPPALRTAEFFERGYSGNPPRDLLDTFSEVLDTFSEEFRLAT